MLGQNISGYYRLSLDKSGYEKLIHVISGVIR
jgi:hypothetical protein